MALDERADSKRRLTTVFGWVGGGSLGLLLNYGFFLVSPSDYPVVPTTFVAFVGGAFGGMALADRLGPRGFRPLGIVAGISLALMLVLVLAGAMSEGSQTVP
jgi:peptidoglycan/LPS O-acetylase OafA/YrhL